MIRKFKSLLKSAMKTISSKEIECAIDENIVPCETLGEVYYSPEAIGTWNLSQEKPFTGYPAPVYLGDDEWFGPAPVKTEKQESYIKLEEATERLHEDIRKESGTVESKNIHQEMYDIATQNWNTVSESQGGSENFHEGHVGWNSGNGMGQFK